MRYVSHCAERGDICFFGHVLRHFFKQNQKQLGTKLQKQDTTSRKPGFCVGPQHHTREWSVGMQAVQWCGVHSSARDLSLNKKGYGFKQNSVYL